MFFKVKDDGWQRYILRYDERADQLKLAGRL